MPSTEDLHRYTSQANQALEEAEYEGDNTHPDVLDKLSERKEVLKPYIDATQDAVNLGMTYIRSEINSFKASCGILMKALDVVAEVHPFAKVVVVAFKTAITFELARRNNDKRVRALHVSMKDVMNVIAILQNVTKGNCGDDGLTIEDRLRARMVDISKLINTCVKQCESFQEKRFAVKLYKSLAWDSKLEGFMTAFDEHQSALHKDLAMHASVGISQANLKLVQLGETSRVTASRLSMVQLFQELRSPEERELRKFIDSKGGPDAFLKDDTLMRELVMKSEKDLELLQSGEHMKVVKEIQRATKIDLQQLLEENQEAFENKLTALQDTIRANMESSLTREGDRIIDKVLSGPHDRLRDPIVYEVWTEMGWKGSTKARHVVAALREFMAERYSDAAQQSQSDTQPAENDKQVASGISKYTPVEDRWALEYITMRRMQPLLEALDDDGSSFVTVAEMNAFTSARPSYWSLAHWMAFWVAGFPLTIQFYTHGIRQTIDRMSDLEDRILPSNRDYLHQFMGSSILKQLHALLAGAYGARFQEYWSVDLFERFQDYTVDQEEQMRKTLQTMKFTIDEPGTLTLVLGSGRLEKYLLPLLYIMLERVWKVLKVACQVSIHHEELARLSSSIGVVLRAAAARIETIKTTCKLTDDDPRDRLRKFACGLYYYLEHVEEVPTSLYTPSGIYDAALFLPYDSPLEKLHLKACLDVTTDVLVHGPQVIAVDLAAYEDVDSGTPAESDHPAWRSPLWQRVWRGTYSASSYWNTYMNNLTLDISPEVDGPVHGSGEDTYSGPYKFEGKRCADYITFEKADPMITWTCFGDTNDDNDIFEGFIGLMQGTGDKEENFAPVDAIQLQRRPLYYWSHRPRDDEIRINKPRALWRFALDAIRHAVRATARNTPWEFYSERREQRIRYLQRSVRVHNDIRDHCYMDHKALAIYHEASMIERGLAPADVKFYRSLTPMLARRVAVHNFYCDFCLTGFLLLTRAVCLDCSEIEVDNEKDRVLVDCCSECTCTHQNKPVPGSQAVTTPKDPHRLLQLRNILPDIKVIDMIKDNYKSWEAEAATIGDGGAVQCIKCLNTVSRPFWCCLDCDPRERAYICLGCNKNDDSEYIPSLMKSLYEEVLWETQIAELKELDASEREEEPRDEPKHQLRHTLAMCLPIGEPEAKSVPLTVEDRLVSMETRIMSMEGGMQRLEEMIERLLDSLQNTA